MILGYNNLRCCSIALFFIASALSEESVWSNSNTTTEDRTLYIGGNDNISIFGSFFVVGADDYTCIFRTSVINILFGDYEVRSVPAMIITSQLAQCLTPAKNWDLPETWVVLQFQKSNRLIRSTGPSSFYQIRSILLGVSPSAGQACGMISVTITGRGFDVRSATPYTLVLDSRYAGPCTAVNLTTLNCVVLRWQSTLTTLLLVNHNLTSSLISADKLGLGSWIGADPSRSNSSILFQFWPCCERIEVGQAVSLVPTVIPIEGVGMKSLKNASCIFTFGEKRKIN